MFLRFRYFCSATFPVPPFISFSWYAHSLVFQRLYSAYYSHWEISRNHPTVIIFIKTCAAKHLCQWPCKNKLWFKTVLVGKRNSWRLSKQSATHSAYDSAELLDWSCAYRHKSFSGRSNNATGTHSYILLSFTVDCTFLYNENTQFWVLSQDKALYKNW